MRGRSPPNPPFFFFYSRFEPTTPRFTKPRLTTYPRNFFPDCSPHNQGELWGLAIHPSDVNKLATCSDDGTLRLWNITPGKGRDVFARAWPRKEDSQPIPNSSFNTGCARSVAWHPDGNSLAVGTVAGKVHVYELYSYKGQSRLTCIKELDTRNEWISDLKYSPCTPEDPTGGRYLAVGSHENAVDIYDTKKPNAEYELVGTCRGHSSFITHLGWSKDGTVLYTNSGDYELLFWYAPKGVQIVNGVDVKDVGWADTTGVLGKGFSHSPRSASAIAHTRPDEGTVIPSDCLRIHITRD